MERRCGVPGSGFLFYTLADFIAIDRRVHLHAAVYIRNCN
jgi:hypothetical protein